MASGLLLTYLSLICSRSDWTIAKEKGLLNDKISFEAWITLTSEVHKTIGHFSLKNVNRRYQHGELRLPRLNLIHRFCCCHSMPNLPRLLRGYHYGFDQKSSFLARNYTWVLTAIIYMTIVLTAMQVGWDTPRLKDNNSFQKAAEWFAVFSIIAPLLVVISILCVFMVAMLIYASNWSYTKKRQKKARANYQDPDPHKLP